MFDKKYIAGIASFAGAINNVKAAADTNVFVNIGGTIYSESDKGKVEKSKLSNLDGLISELANLTGENVLKNGSSSAEPLDLKDIVEKYFVKSVKVGSTEKLADEKLADISTATIDVNNKLTVELVPKRECIKFKYTGAKVLTKAAEDELLSKIIQGQTLKEVKIDNLTTDAGNKLGGIELEEDSKIVGSNDIKLFESTPCELTINSDKIGNGIFKTVVCKFAEGVEEKLVKDLDLEKLCVEGDALNTKSLTEVFNALNGIELTSENVKVFFNPSVKLKIKCNGTKALDDSANKTDNNNNNFIFIENILEIDINPIFLKKEFKVEFDDEGNNTKKVDDGILKKITDALNAKFSDTVAIKVSDITEEISKVKNKNPNDIILNTAFTNLNAISFEGVNKSGTALEVTDVVNSKDITVKLKGTVFAKDIVKTEINLTCDLANVKKGDKVLKGEVKNIISPILNKTLTEVTAIKDIIDALNAALSGKFADDSKQIADEDINFGSVITGGNITKSGAITIKASFASKLKDDCFDNKKPQPEPSKDSDSKGTNGDGGNQNEGNKDQKGYCGSNKK